MNRIRACLITVLLFAGALTLATACTNDRAPLGDGGGGGHDGAGSGDGSAAGDGPGSSDSAPASPCPATLPAQDDGCPHEGLVCQFGNEPRRWCRPQATCKGGTWQVQQAPASCTTLPPATCPATRETAAGAKCATMDAYCSYPGDLQCHCTNCSEYPLPFCNGDPTWHCDAPNVDETCPPGKPNLGSACTVADKTCRYECGADGGRRCQGGVWVTAEGGPCPVSTRRLKKDIVYVDRARLRKLARRTLSMRLATYRYKDPSYGVGPQLGFILEDVGKSFAGDPARGRVNLYGYTSMLLATVQAQQRAIDALRREVRALRTRVTRRRR